MYGLCYPLIQMIISEMITEAVAQRSSVKMVFLEFRKIHRKTPAPESLF